MSGLRRGDLTEGERNHDTRQTTSGDCQQDKEAHGCAHERKKSNLASNVEIAVRQGNTGVSETDAGGANARLSVRGQTVTRLSKGRRGRRPRTRGSALPG